MYSLYFHRIKIKQIYYPIQDYYPAYIVPWMDILGN